MSTTGIVLIEEHAQRVKPPRMLAVPFFFGNALGEADDAEYQHKVLQHTFDLLDRNEGPVLESLPGDMIPDILMQGSETTNESQEKGLNAADELTALRAYYEQWTKAHKNRTSVGLSKIPQRRFRAIVRFFEDYINGEVSDMKERPAEFTVPQFIRYCVDDLKAFYYEARMVQRPDGSDREIHEWFWSESTMGGLLMALAQRMRDDEDAQVQAIAYGIAR
ncbi:MAG: hypothetical protein FI710_08140 [SAR202 cluster bacterium]|jgi:hypothetical protein|nr:hypothetical protein [Dehalococcoidia bacterium]MQG10224.1 hypothetical protein [SAR202 cluster bacterium]MQG54963.1 hypothetical protein [SAR202 cluster bacterium]|tara:strand:+ start:315 stop:974 length:660 start_codon:yes stop_codon:yes gene_type:complete